MNEPKQIAIDESQEQLGPLDDMEIRQMHIGPADRDITFCGVKPGPDGGPITGSPDRYCPKCWAVYQWRLREREQGR